jgi:predicted enzyme related to lactoylglutathione lyase
VSTTEISSDPATAGAAVESIDLKLEAIVIPVADVDRAKKFYAALGWRLDADFPFDNGFRVVQFTPPGSRCSVQFGTKITSAAPGTAEGLYLVVADIAAARDQLIARGAKSAMSSMPAPRARSSRPTRADASAGPRRSTPRTTRSPRSAIRTAIAGCCRRSRRGCRGGSK